MTGKLAADYSGIELGIGESLLMKAIGESTGRTLKIVKDDQQKIGDLGLVAAMSRGKQPTMFKPKPLTIRGVWEGLMDIALVEGQGSQGRKVDGIKKLLSSADVALAKGQTVDINKDKGGPSESKFIIRALEGKMRLGLADKTLQVALAQAMVAHAVAQDGGKENEKKKIPSEAELKKGEEVFKMVYSELPAYEVIVPALLEGGIWKLRETCKLQPGVPLKPMLAKPTKSIGEVLDRFEGKDFTCEYKYDGERAQIHFVSHDAKQ
ncbi:ATP-dependent DNA ligase Cdc17, partial [Teratosphaeriaceae sp. CCFEE 6253]